MRELLGPTAQRARPTPVTHAQRSGGQQACGSAPSAPPAPLRRHSSRGCSSAPRRVGRVCGPPLLASPSLRAATSSHQACAWTRALIGGAHRTAPSSRGALCRLAPARGQPKGARKGPAPQQPWSHATSSKGCRLQARPTGARVAPPGGRGGIKCRSRRRGQVQVSAPVAQGASAGPQRLTSASHVCMPLRRSPRGHGHPPPAVLPPVPSSLAVLTVVSAGSSSCLQ